MSDTTLATSPPLTAPAGFPTLHRVHPRYGDLGPDGRISTVAVARWFEDARVGAAHASFRRLADAGGPGEFRILLASQRIERLADIAPDADHRVGLGVRRVGRSSFTYGYGVFVDEHCVATGESVTVLATADGPTVLPDALRDDLAAMTIDEPDTPPAERPGEERKDPSAYPFGIDIRARFGDVDTNRHGNNVALAGWYADAVAELHLAVLGASPGGPPPELAPTGIGVQYVTEVAYPGTYRLGVRAAVDGDVVRYACGLFDGSRCVGLADLVGPTDPSLVF